MREECITASAFYYDKMLNEVGVCAYPYRCLLD